jgi:hypothetical protein
LEIFFVEYKRNFKMLKQFIFFVVFVFFLFSCSDDAVENDMNYSVKEPGGVYYGKTYNEWSISWWQWVLSMPKDAHPLMDNAPAGTNQPENVWFLGGTIGFSEVGLDKAIERTITLPFGTALFIPVSTIMAPASLGYPLDSLDIIAAGEMEFFDELYIEINGKRIANIDEYRFASDRLFSYTVPENNLFDIEAGTYENDAYADGFYIMLNNLEKDTYKIKYYARQDAYNYIQDVTYFVTVE